jgi:hypothetical protein
LQLSGNAIENFSHSERSEACILILQRSDLSGGAGVLAG